MERKYVFSGYVEGRSLPAVSRAQAKKLTHINVAFGIVTNNLIDLHLQEHYLPYIKAIREYNPEVQILLSTGGGGMGGHGDATKPENLQKFVDSCLEEIVKYGFDGLDCDWEFPEENEMVQYVELLKAYRSAFDKMEAERGKKMWLTAAWPVGNWFYDRVKPYIKDIIPLLDYINVMNYDLNEYDKPGVNTRTGFHSNAYPAFGDPNPDCSKYAVMGYNVLGIPNDKIVMGTGFYHKQWNGVPDVNHGLFQRASSAVGFGSGVDTYDQLRYNGETNPDYIKYWHEESKSCWLYNGDQFITYEDPMAVRYKCEFIKENNLRGAMYWAHAYDPSSTLFNVIYDTLYL